MHLRKNSSGAFSATILLMLWGCAMTFSGCDKGEYNPTDYAVRNLKKLMDQSGVSDELPSDTYRIISSGNPSSLKVFTITDKNDIKILISEHHNTRNKSVRRASKILDEVEFSAFNQILDRIDFWQSATELPSMENKITSSFIIEANFDGRQHMIVRRSSSESGSAFDLIFKWLDQNGALG